MKPLLAILGLLLTYSTAFAQGPKNRLYKISAPSGDSYVLGTMHMGVGIDEFNTDIHGLIIKSRIVLPEIALTPDQLATFKTDPYRTLFEASPLPAQVETDNEMVTKLQALGFPKYIAERLPDNACMSLQVLLMARPELPSLDFQVLEQANENKLQVLALDSNELRARARKESDATGGACSLRQILNAYTKEQILESLDANLAVSIEFYKSGEREKEEVLNDPIVKSRNLAWLPVIAEEVKKGAAFVSVGYAHLGGKSGVLQLLRDRGFRVRLVE